MNKSVASIWNALFNLLSLALYAELVSISSEAVFTASCFF